MSSIRNIFRFIIHIFLSVVLSEVNTVNTANVISRALKIEINNQNIDKIFVLSTSILLNNSFSGKKSPYIRAIFMIYTTSYFIVLSSYFSHGAQNNIDAEWMVWILFFINILQRSYEGKTIKLICISCAIETALLMPSQYLSKKLSKEYNFSNFRQGEFNTFIMIFSIFSCISKMIIYYTPCIRKHYRSSLLHIMQYTVTVIIKSIISKYMPHNDICIYRNIYINSELLCLFFTLSFCDTYFILKCIIKINKIIESYQVSSSNRTDQSLSIDQEKSLSDRGEHASVSMENARNHEDAVVRPTFIGASEGGFACAIAEEGVECTTEDIAIYCGTAAGDTTLFNNFNNFSSILTLFFISISNGARSASSYLRF